MIIIVINSQTIQMCNLYPLKIWTEMLAADCPVELRKGYEDMISFIIKDRVFKV